MLLASSFKINWESLPKRDPPIEKHRLLGHNAELASNPGYIEGLNRRVSRCFARSGYLEVVLLQSDLSRGKVIESLQERYAG